MAKNLARKKIPLVLRKRIRKTSAAILLIVAIVVATIPATKIEADSSGGSGTGVAKIVYDATLSTQVGSTEYAYAGSTIYPAYQIVDLGDGSYRKLWIYEVWVKNVNGTDFGVISNFNSSYNPVNNTLTIPSNVTTQFLEYKDTDVDGYIATLTTNDWLTLNTYFATAKDTDGNFINPITSVTITATQKMTYYLKYIGCEGYEARKVIVEIVGGANVESYIPYSAVNGYKSITNLNVAAIGDGAFYDSVTGTGKANHITNLILEIQNNIIAIGNDAFRGASSLTSITIGSGVKNIGNRAFQTCTNLSSVTFSEGLVSVGVESFRDCNSLVNVILPNTLETVKSGAFAYCKKLSVVNMSASTLSNLTIGDFSFYDCPNITNIVFGDLTKSIGNGAFSVSTSAPLLENGWTDIDLPDYIVTLGTHMFDGRYTLKSVSLPKSFGATFVDTTPTDILDAGFFFDCTALETVIFPSTCKYASFVPTAFADATTDFYVQGPPKSISGTSGYAYPRIAAHTANVPYMYVDNGVTYYEVQIGNEFFRVNQDNELISFETTATGTFNLNIPAKVGSYKVKSIADGCFTAVKNQILTINIPDDSISALKANVFSNCENLTSVSIGNSVTSIGDKAFYNCRNLQKISFATPSAGYSSMTIGNQAFTTNSATLTLQGDISPLYAPFTWATSSDNYLNTNGKRVCYKSNAPSNLTAIYDNNTGLVTLVDYPIYDNVDTDNAALITWLKNYYLGLYPQLLYPTEYDEINNYSFSIKDKFDLIYEQLIYSDKPWEKLSLAEQAIYNNIINITVPEGIESIDAYSFFTNAANSENWSYIDSNRRSIYTDVSTGVHGGLFSGKFDDYAGLDNREKFEIGNDRIKTVTLNDTEYIPDYAFESCEGLQSVTLGSALNKMGVLPFAGCSGMTSIAGNDNFVSENGIIYEKLANGTLNIVQCLPNRGNTVGTKAVTTETDPLLSTVSAIASSAFKDCTYITKVDLSKASTLTTIPKYCFNGCTSLYNGITLPSSVSRIDEYAFTNTSAAVLVTIPNKTVSIRDSAFDAGQGLIRCFDNSSALTYAKYYNIEYELMSDQFTVSFLDFDGTSLGADQYITSGENAEPPADPIRSGYTFTGWSKSYKNILADTTLIAIYVAGSSSATVTPNPNGTTTVTPIPGTNGTKYNVVITNGSGSGSYAGGTIVNITANASADGKVFDKWTTSSAGTYFASSSSVTTSFVMPSNDVAIVPTYKAPTSATTPGATTPSTTGSATTTPSASVTGTVITITKPGISDVDKATATVSGSTDNFVVKISESASAQALIEAALLASSETFDTIKYFPMDISLYDTTGTVKITDSTGISVAITIPIPDELKEYGGNCKVAAVVNGALEILPVTFVTIDGVACVRFTAEHFSPYVVYVDTGNLQAGAITDATPKTGDMIAPKWFLCIGLLCASAVLFLKKDKKDKNGMITFA